MNIPGYTIEREIGHGGMSTVYLALQESLDRYVALKVMSPALAADRNFGERFLKEGRTVAKLSHPNILGIYDIGQSGHHFYMAIEYIPGGDLKQRIHQGTMNPRQALQIVRQVAEALGYAHDKGLVHRDVKPENVLFREDGSVVLADFGIAKAVGSGTRMTGTGMSIGTPHYMSPEQAMAKDVDGRSDLYSLGVVFYEMLTGKVPFDADGSIAICMKHVNEPPAELMEPLASFQPVVGRLLEKEPASRFGAASDLIVDLENLHPVNSDPRMASSSPNSQEHGNNEALSGFSAEDVTKETFADEGLTGKVLPLTEVMSSTEKGANDLGSGVEPDFSNKAEKRMDEPVIKITDRGRIVTNLFILISLFVYLATTGWAIWAGLDLKDAFLNPETKVLLHSGAQLWPLVLAEGEWWRCITYAFVHADLVHLAFNMYFLHKIGARVEKEIGGFGFILLCFVSTLATTGMMSLWRPNVPYVGAGGIIFAIISFSVIYFIRSEEQSKYITRKFVKRWSLICIVLYAFILLTGGDVVGVLGGALFGGVLGAVFPFLKVTQAPRKRVVKWVGVTCVMLTLSSLFLLIASWGSFFMESM